MFQTSERIEERHLQPSWGVGEAREGVFEQKATGMGGCWGAALAKAPGSGLRRKTELLKVSTPPQLPGLGDRSQVCPLD